MKKATKFYQLNTIYNTNLLNFFFVCITSLIFLKKYCLAEDLISGYHFSEPSTQKIQDDDFLNPGFIWVENGELLWNKKEQSSQLSCKSCHGAASEMTGVALKYPKITKKGDLINLEQQINICRNENMSAETYEPESKNLLALSVLLYYKSRGLKQDIKINEKNKEHFNLGKKLYFKKIGQMGLSCNQCHDERVGKNLRAEKVSQGHVNGFPSYLLRWSKIASVHKRIQFCNEQARAIPFKIFSKEYNALQLYMTWRGRGLKIETPAVRK